MAELSIIEKHAKGEGDNALLVEAISLLKIGAASPVIASTSMFLIVTALGSIKLGETTVDPNNDNLLSQIDVSTRDTANGLVNWLWSLTGSKGEAPKPFTADLIIKPDGTTKDGKPFWNVYLIPSVDATNLKIAILAYLTATGIGGTGGSTQLTGLISGGIAALK